MSDIITLTLGIPIGWVEAIANSPSGAKIVEIYDEKQGGIIYFELEDGFTDEHRALLRAALATVRVRSYCGRN